MSVKATASTLAVACLALAAGTASASADAITIGSVRIDFADPAQKPARPSETQFVEAFLAAARQKNLAAMRALVHPASLACSASGAHARNLETVLTRPFRHDIPDDVRIAIAPMPDAEKRGAISPMLMLPATPDVIVVFDYKWLQKAPDGKVMRDIGMTIVRMLARDGETLKLAEYCLTEDGARLFEQKERGLLPPASAK